MAVSNRLEHRVALVTGASSGIGRAIALAYVSHGAKLVVIADLQEKAPTAGDSDEETTLELINKKYGPDRAAFVQTDVTKFESVKQAVEETVRLGGRLDIIVNNAGLGKVAGFGRLHEFEEAGWDKMMSVNLNGVFYGCKYALAQFLKQEPTESGRKGWIINLASVLGYTGLPGPFGAYCASKGAVLNLSRQIAVDYGKDKIHCNALCPGLAPVIRTPMNRNVQDDQEFSDRIKSMHPWGSWGEPSDVAKAAVFLASDDASWVTGVGLPVDGGYLAR